MSTSVELVAVFEHAVSSRLLLVERFVLSLPYLLRSAFEWGEVRSAPAEKRVSVHVALGDHARRADAEVRFRFWAGQAGGATDGAVPPRSPGARFEPAQLAAEVHRAFTALGAPPDRRWSSTGPVLVLDAGALHDCSYDPEARALFVPGALAPVPGDDLRLSIREGDGERGVDCPARVLGVVAGGAARGAGPGFTLGLSAPPPALERALGAARRPIAPATGHAPVEDAGAGAARPRALVVDDDAHVRALLAGAFAAHGFDVATARDGEEALGQIAGDVHGFDLLLTDLYMPRMDGEALVRTVRRGGESDLAVVVMTGIAESGIELERAGADVVLDKALGAEILATASAAVLQRKRAARR